VSRTSFAWGIPVPEPDPEGLSHVIYVWMDALTNYLSDLCPDSGQIAGRDVEHYWPSTLHVIGKDILRFHTVYWPAFLLAAKLPLPRGIFAHGWWTVRGEKISKSMPATRIDPTVLADALGAGSRLGRAIGVDAMRYYLLREVPLGNDGDFTFESLFGRFNSDLANDLGNLVSRSLTLIDRFSVEHAPRRDPAAQGAIASAVAQLDQQARQSVRLAAQYFDAMAPSRALEEIWRLVGAVNAFIDQTQPWAMAKAKDPALPHALWTLQASLWVIARLIAPVLPTTATEVRGWIGDHDAGDKPRELVWPAEGPDGVLAQTPEPAIPIYLNMRFRTQSGPLFPRLDEAAQARIVTQVVGDAAAPAAAAPAPKGKPPAKGKPAASVPAAAPALAEAPALAAAAGALAADAPAAGAPISIDDFGRIELRTGRILSAASVPKAKKLLHLSVDLGEAQPRSIVAGLAEAYAPDQLVGRQVIVVANLAPATIRGIRSEGMLLAAGEEAIAGLSALDRDVPPGTRVR
jgi:methionyl-tRNA synthetase